MTTSAFYLTAGSTIAIFAVAAEVRPAPRSEVEDRSCIDKCIIDSCRQAGRTVTIGFSAVRNQ